MITLGDVRAVVLFADDPPALARWYRAQIALRPLVEGPHFIALAAGQLTLFIQRTSEGHRPGRGGVRPHFTVRDCAAALDQLQAAGAGLILPLTDTGGELVAAVSDPAGNPIGLLQPKAHG